MKTIKEKITYKNLQEVISVEDMKIINNEYNQWLSNGFIEEDSLLLYRSRIAFEGEPTSMQIIFLHHEISSYITNQYFNRPLSSITLD